MTTRKKKEVEPAAKDRVIWVCHDCWPRDRECLTLGRVTGPKACDVCGKVIEGFDDLNPIWRSWFKKPIPDEWMSGEMRAILNALKVLSWTRNTRGWLKVHDPKALEQADLAVKLTGQKPACGWDGLDEKMKAGFLCPHCNKGKLTTIIALEPYYPDHLQCPTCDSTFNEGE